MTSTDELTALSEQAIDAFNGLLERAHAEQPPERTLACRDGCSHCCYQPEITVTAIEIFRVAGFILSQFSQKEVEILTKALVKNTASSSPSADPASWTLAACPLLQDGVCSVYTVRPLVCRGANSYDVSDCERARQQNRQQPTIHIYSPQEQAADLTIGALQQGIVSAGREAALLDLGPALAIALGNADAKQLWQNGELVFTTARARYC